MFPYTLHDLSQALSCGAAAGYYLYTKNLPRGATVLAASSAVSYLLSHSIFPVPVIRPLRRDEQYNVGLTFVDGTPTLPRFAHFYPVHSREQLKKIAWVPNGNLNYVLEMAKNFGVPEFLFRHIQRVKMEVAPDAPPLKTTDRKYIVFSHGLHGHQTMYATLAMEWASRGYHVLCPEHTDGSAAFTVDHTKKPILYRDIKTKSDEEQLVTRYQQMSYRTNEYLKMIEHATPDAKEIILAGHSFGGSTALNALCDLSMQKNGLIEGNPAVLDKYTRIHRVLLLDVWHFPLVHPEAVHRFDCLKTDAFNSPYRKNNIPRVLIYNSEQWSEWKEHALWTMDTFHRRMQWTNFFQTTFQNYTDHYSVSDMGRLTPFIWRKKFPYGRHGAHHISQCADETLEVAAMYV